MTILGVSGLFGTKSLFVTSCGIALVAFGVVKGLPKVTHQVAEIADDVKFSSAGSLVVVSNANDLSAAIRSAKGPRRILLEPGTYAPIAIRGVQPTAPVVIASRIPSNPAVLTGLDIRESKSLEFNGVTFRSNPEAKQEAFLFADSQKLVFQGIKAMGEDGPDGELDKVMFVRRCTDVIIKQSEFTHAWIALSLLDTQKVKVESNFFHDLRMDAVRGGGNSDILIAFNYFTDFRTVLPDHPDAIQFWTSRQTSIAHDISIVGNVVHRGTGRAVQGIFMNDETRHLPYNNVVIRDNLVIGAMYNGITTQGTRIRIIDNVVSAYPDQKSWIRARGDVSLSNNRAPIYLINDKLAKNPIGNVVTGQDFDQGATSLTQWARGRNLEHYPSALKDLVARHAQ